MFGEKVFDFRKAVSILNLTGDLRRTPDEDLVPFGLSAGDSDLV